MKYSKHSVKILTSFILLSAGFFLTGNTLYAQDEVKASAPSVVSVNRAFNYTISAGTQGKVTVQPVDGIRVLSGPSQMVSYQSSNVNGKLTTEMNVSYTWLMIAEREGEFTIPPATLKDGRKTVTTNEVKITAVPGTANVKSNDQSGQASNSGLPDPVIMKLIPSKTELYEGEQLVVSTKIFVRSRIENPGLNSPTFEGFWVESLEGDNSVRNEVVDGYSYNTQVVQRNLLTAQKKGEITIDPATLDVTVLNRVQRRRSAFDDLFDDPFFNDPFDRFERERQVVTSNSLKITIKPLPDGAPADFAGAVGNLSVSARLKQDSVQTNNALSLVILVKGKGNLNLIDAPGVDFPPDLEVFEPKKIENISHSTGGTEGEVSFEYVIIPRHNGNYRISPVTFSFFNPSIGRYDRYVSSDFRFTAFGGEDDEGGVSNSGPGFFREDVRSLDTDIRFIKLNPGNLTMINSYLITRTWVYVIFFGGILLLIASLVFWRNKLKKEADIFYVRNKKARKVAKKRLKNAWNLLKKEDDALFEEILKAIWGYLSDRLAINTADLTRERAGEEMNKRGVEESLQQKLWEVVEECEYSRYSPESSESRQKLYEKAAECMSELEQKI
ncbi:MAG: BatD family protein [Bacteroidales bacterium]